MHSQGLRPGARASTSPLPLLISIKLFLNETNNLGNASTI